MKSLLKVDAEQRKFAETDFIRYYSDWSFSAWDEQDWAKVMELSVRETMIHRQKMANICQSAKCLSCPDFLKHVSTDGQWSTNLN